MTCGDPRITARMPAPVIKALKQLAQGQNKIPSDILRDLAIKELKRAGYSIEPKEGEKTSEYLSIKSPLEVGDLQAD